MGACCRVDGKVVRYDETDRSYTVLSSDSAREEVVDVGSVVAAFPVALVRALRRRAADDRIPISALLDELEAWGVTLSASEEDALAESLLQGDSRATASSRCAVVLASCCSSRRDVVCGAASLWCAQCVAAYVPGRRFGVRRRRGQSRRIAVTVALAASRRRHSTASVRARHWCVLSDALPTSTAEVM
jgi:hypothetical protein